jgi:hypothetical protein
MSTRVSLIDLAEATGLTPSVLAQEAATLQAASGLLPSEAPPPSSRGPRPTQRPPAEASDRIAA